MLGSLICKLFRTINKLLYRYHFLEKFIIESQYDKRHLEIDRYGTGDNYMRRLIRTNFYFVLSGISSLPIQSNQAIKIEQIYGLIGVIDLISGPFLIVIKSVRSVGQLNDAEIYRVIDTDLIPFKTDLHLSEHQVSTFDL